LAGLAADGHPVCADVRRRPRHAIQEPRTAPETTQRQGTGERTKDRRGAKRTALRRRLRRRRPQLALPMAGAARLGGMGGRSAFPGVLRPLCRGAA